jgi:hypothetical protein
MGATAWFYVAFAAVVVMIVATVWAAMVLQAGGQQPAGGQDAVAPGDEPGATHTPERRAA